MLAQHQSSETTKMLLVGDSGGGKTGSLASLAIAGYNLRILDMDNGLDVVFDLLKHDPAAMSRVAYRTITDKFTIKGGNPVPATALAWQTMTSMLNNWSDGDVQLGPVHSWGPKDVLVLDSATFAGNAAMRHILSMNNRLASLPTWKDWQAPQAMMENLFSLLYDKEVKCNVIVISHLIEIGEDLTEKNEKGDYVKVTRPGSERKYPATLGKALSPKVGRYFNACLLAKSVPLGLGVERKLFTDSQGIIELKNNAPTSVKKEYPIKTGLAQYFADVRAASKASGGSTPA